MHNDDMAKKLNEPANKGDLLALKNDVSELKNDMTELKTELKGDMVTLKNDIMSSVKGDFKQFAIQALALDAKQTARTEALGSTIQKAYSALMGRMDAFMSSTLKVQADQTFHTHRLDVHDQEIKLIKAHIGLDPQGR